MSRKIKLIFFLLIIFSAVCVAQTNKHAFYLQPEYNFGKIIPNYKDTFPKTSVQQGIILSIGSINTDTSSWAKFYNYPETGIMLHGANFGNNKVFGHQFGISTYVSFKVFNPSKADYRLKMGLGIAYFTTIFDSTTNITNNLVGAPFTWDYKIFLYRNLLKTNQFNLLLGIGFSHESNGHAVMPNLGINSALISLSGQFYTRKNNLNLLPKREKGKYHSPKKMFINYREGYGFHAQNSAEGPKEGRILPVYASSIAFGYIFNQHIKLRGGLTYKFYEQYRTHLSETYVEDLSDNPNLSSSAIVLFVGNEFLMSHVSIDLELGVNLYKPFYRKFHPSNKIAIRLMKLIATRVGMNLYLFNTNKLPTHNFFIGANINANLGKADFTEFSIGYTYKFNN